LSAGNRGTQELSAVLHRNGEITLKRIAWTLTVLWLSAALSATALAQDAPSAAQTQEANLKAYVEMLRKDLNKDKVAILTELMQFSPEESAKFWPVYNEYDKALTKLKDERIAFIRMWGENYGSLTDDKVTAIAMGLLDVEGRRNQLKKEYFQRMSRVVSVKQAARFLQIENQIEKLVDLQIAASLPIVE
jgi:hypothetical protein